MRTYNKQHGHYKRVNPTRFKIKQSKATSKQDYNISIDDQYIEYVPESCIYQEVQY